MHVEDGNAATFDEVLREQLHEATKSNQADAFTLDQTCQLLFKIAHIPGRDHFMRDALLFTSADGRSPGTAEDGKADANRKISIRKIAVDGQEV